MARVSWLLLALVVSGGAWAQGDPAAGEIKAGMCSGCHSVGGYRNAYPAYSVPKLGGQHPAYIVSALKAYQSRQRSHPTMHAIAASLSEKDMQDLAAYFAATNE